MPASAENPHPGVEVLAAQECWRLLGLGHVGRLAVSGDDGAPDVMPINYLTHDGAIFFRTAPGGKLRSIEADPAVAFEIDGQDDASRWSVVVRGTAHRLTTDSEIEASGITLLISWSPTRKEHFVRVEPQSVSGRRFPKRFEAQPITPPLATTGSVETSDTRELSAQDGVLPKPWPIPHRPPVPPTR